MRSCRRVSLYLFNAQVRGYDGSQFFPVAPVHDHVERLQDPVGGLFNSEIVEDEHIDPTVSVDDSLFRYFVASVCVPYLQKSSGTEMNKGIL